jgi:outer membrane protein assembly factor BamB
MRRFATVLAALATLALAAPASAQLTTSSSWPQVGHDPGLTRRAFVTGSQTGTPAAGFPAPLYGGSLQIQSVGGNTPVAGPPAIYLDGNVIAGTSATNNSANGIAQLDYVNAANVTPPGAVRSLFTASGPWPFTTGYDNTVPAVGSDGVMFVSGSDGDVWAVPPSGPAVNEFTGPAGTNTVSSPTLGANGVLYFSAGTGNDGPVDGTGAIYAVNSASGQTLWSFPLSVATSSPVAVDPQGNAYATIASFTGTGKLLSFNSSGRTRWTFDPPGRAAVSGSPLVYGGTVYVMGHVGINVTTAYAVNASNGQELWGVTVRGIPGFTSPALGPSGNVMALSFGALTALNRKTGKSAWTFTLPSVTATLAPLVDGSGDTYVFANGGSGGGGGTVLAVGPTGQQLWQGSVGTPTQNGGTFGEPTGGAIGLDGTIYVSAADGKVYAFTDPS